MLSSQTKDIQTKDSNFDSDSEFDSIHLKGALAAASVFAARHKKEVTQSKQIDHVRHKISSILKQMPLSESDRTLFLKAVNFSVDKIDRLTTLCQTLDSNRLILTGSNEPYSQWCDFLDTFNCRSDSKSFKMHK